MSLTDRELIAATFIAVAALAKRLTGADLCVTIGGIDGGVHSLTGNNPQVTWVENGEAVSASPEAILAARETLLFGDE